MKLLIAASCALFFTVSYASHAQVRVRNPKETAERSVENRANNRVDQGVERGLDKVEEGIGNVFKKKEKKNDKSSSNKAPAAETQTTSEGTESNPATQNGQTHKASQANNGGGNNPSSELKVYSKFDFVPGEKIIAEEDFSQTNLGDFPTGWNTNSSAELVKLAGRPEKWLYMSADGFFLPEFVNNMPENFTLEFDVFTRYRSSNILSYGFYLSAAENVKNDLANAYITNGFYFGWLGAESGAQYFVYEKGEEISKNEGLTINAFDCKGENNEEPSLVRLSIWRQKSRLRVYVNETKILDIPKAFNPALKYNSFKFGSKYMNYSENEHKDEFMVANIRYAVGAPDTRSKLMTEGRFVTRGILFDVNSDRMKPSSYGVLKEIATVLKENTTVKIKIIGHTDSDGDDAKNLDLSKRRAAAVKQALGSEFGIAATRLETDGKGEAQPSDSNATPQGKANNRRVEFIKL